jgi:glycosyltransferase involved in cell wall biosynthesis
MYMKLSICIATKNRSTHLLTCLGAILENKYNDFEILIIDQSTNFETNAVVDGLKNGRIRYIKTNTTGKSIALNIGIRESLGDICVFTDDDCIVSTHWLQNIYDYYQKHPDTAAVFGQTLPYKQKEHKHLRCPAIFKNNTSRIVTDPYIDHFTRLGNGNNMSVKKNIFSSIGTFQQWLGPGSISSPGGEEGELIYRILKNNMKVAFDPKIIVYHNKWLSVTQFNKLTILYDIGTIAWYTYWCIRNKDYRLWNKIKSRKSLIKNWVKRVASCLLRRKGAPFVEIYYAYLQFWSLAKGILIGAFASVLCKNI